MELANYILFFISTLTVYYSVKKFGWNSIISFALYSQYVYSIPAILGIWKSLTYIYKGTLEFKEFLATTSVAPTRTTFLMLLAWITFFICIYFIKSKSRRVFYVNNRFSKNYLLIISFFVLIGYFLISIYFNSFNWFLLNRDLIYFNPDNNPIFKLGFSFWRWFIIYGLVISHIDEKRKFLLFFLIFLLIYSLSGDRTMPAIVTASFFIVNFFKNGMSKKLPSLKSILFIIILSYLFLFFKDIYILIKNEFGNFDQYLEILIDKSTNPLKNLTRFEPMLNYSVFINVVMEDLRLPLTTIFFGALYNLTIFPSFFGFNANIFNSFITEKFPAVTYGYAGNYLANGYAVLGEVGLIIFPIVLMIVLLKFENQLIIRENILAKSFFIISASTLAIYVPRNGMINMLSFIRQIFLVFIIIYLFSLILKKENFNQ